MVDRGREIHGEVSSADAHSGVVVPLFDAGTKNNAGSLTLAANDLPQITDLTIISAPGGAVSLLSFNATGTVTLFAGTVSTFGGIVAQLATPITCMRGGTLLLTAPVGQVNCQLQGVLIH